MYLISLIEDQRNRLIDKWVELLYDHPESEYDRDAIPELDQICGEGLDACVALLKGEKDPFLKDFVRHILDKRTEWNLESADILRFFWELRKAVISVAETGGDPGAPDWKDMHSHLDPCIEAGVIHLVDALESD
ncbi:MAG: RsbRD N-terminal domain-containing protein [bacterium]